MTYTSFIFFVFLILVSVLYFLVPLKYRWLVLLAASLSFYAYAGLEFLPFILSSALISFFGARILAGIDRKKEKKKARRILLTALILLLGYLAFTKAVRLFRPDMDIIIPLGLSYYTFSVVGYILDVYWRRYEPERFFPKYLLFVCYFPHILQGPIPRYDRLAPQLFEGHRFQYRRVTYGVQLMLFGLFQKLVLADRLKVLVDTVFENYENMHGIVMLTAVVLYAIQIYTDFAGCVNLARGASQIFGVTLEENFNQPYFSASVEEFWRRWHMTLGAWFRDYVGLPVSVSAPVKKWSKAVRKKRGAAAGRNVVSLSALAVVWCCTGIWHGTGLNYLIWAVWQGGIIAIGTVEKERFLRWKDALHITEDSKAFHLFQVARTFLLAGIIPRVITRAPSVPAAGIIFKNIFIGTGIAELRTGRLAIFGWTIWHFWIAVSALLIQLIVSVLKEKGFSIRDRIAALPLPVRWMIYLAALFYVVIFGMYGPGYSAKDFVYMGF